MEELFHKALTLRKNGEVQEALQIFKHLLKEDPNNALLHYQCACSYDNLGKEREAVPYYEEALDIGLDRENTKGAMLGLGSTYRTLGRYMDSKSLLEKALVEFPNELQFQVFYAMTLYNLKQYSKAMELLLKCLTTTTNNKEILAYKNAIDFYSDKLDQTW
ncbi:tetratricopeptide repeat protein [Microbacteriaceae bacterium 4G12]